MSRSPEKTCTGPGCTREPVAQGLCSGHYGQQRRGRPLAPLKGPRGQLGAEALVRLRGLRVSPACAAAVEDDPESAREALEAWARRRKRACPSPE